MLGHVFQSSISEDKLIATLTLIRVTPFPCFTRHEAKTRLRRYPGLSPAQRHGSGLSRCGAGQVYSPVTSDRSCVLVPTRAFRDSHGAAELCLHRAASLQSCVSSPRRSTETRLSRLLLFCGVTSLLQPVRFTASSSLSDSYRTSSASRTVNQTLSQRPQRVQVTPNHALQRTAPRVTPAVGYL